MSVSAGHSRPSLRRGLAGFSKRRGLPGGRCGDGTVLVHANRRGSTRMGSSFSRLLDPLARRNHSGRCASRDHRRLARPSARRRPRCARAIRRQLRDGALLRQGANEQGRASHRPEFEPFRSGVVLRGAGSRARLRGRRALSNSDPGMAPPGALGPSWARTRSPWPLRRRPADPMPSLDIATSVVAQGKIILAEKPSRRSRRLGDRPRRIANEDPQRPLPGRCYQWPATRGSRSHS